MKVIFNRRP